MKIVESDSVVLSVIQPHSTILKGFIMFSRTNILPYNLCYHYKNKLISLKSAIGGDLIHCLVFVYNYINMGYTIGLLLILGIIFYSFTQFGGNIDMLNSAKNSIGNVLGTLKSSVYNTVFPKSEREILVDKLNSDYNILNKFFDDTAPKILESKDISLTDKEALKQAAAKLGNIKSTIQTLQSKESDSKGIIQSIVDKILNINSSQIAEPTSIPPQCQLVCGN